MLKWLTVRTIGTFGTEVANKTIKIIFNKYFKIPRWHFPPILIKIILIKIILILIS